MPIHVRESDGVQLVELEGEFTFGRRALAQPLDLQGRPMDDFSGVIARLLGQGDLRIVLDMQRVNFIDSAGIGELVAAKKRALERGGDIKILRPGRRVRDLLLLTRLDQVFDIHEDEAAAVRSF